MRDEDVAVGVLAEVVDRVGEGDLSQLFQAAVGLDLELGYRLYQHGLVKGEARVS